jgi:probable HAF family extracellular repeat protein
MTAFGICLAHITPEGMLYYGVQSRPFLSASRHGLPSRQAWHFLRLMGRSPASAPAVMRGSVCPGPRSVTEMVDRYQVSNTEVRDLLIDYITRHAVGIDYTTTEALAQGLADLFWSAIERINPAQRDLRLSHTVLVQPRHDDRPGHPGRELQPGGRDQPVGRGGRLGGPQDRIRRPVPVERHEDGRPVDLAERVRDHDSGQIAGTCGHDPGTHACLDSNGTVTQLPDPRNSTPINCGGGAINNNGQIAGGCDTSSYEHAVLWQNGTATDLGTFGGPQATASAINNLSQVVGFAQTSTDADHGFLWSNGKMTGRRPRAYVCRGTVHLRADVVVRCSGT